MFNSWILRTTKKGKLLKGKKEAFLLRIQWETWGRRNESSPSKATLLMWKDIPMQEHSKVNWTQDFEKGQSWTRKVPACSSSPVNLQSFQKRFVSAFLKLLWRDFSFGMFPKIIFLNHVNFLKIFSWCLNYFICLDNWKGCDYYYYYYYLVLLSF